MNPVFKSECLLASDLTSSKCNKIKSNDKIGYFTNIVIKGLNSDAIFDFIVVCIFIKIKKVNKFLKKEKKRAKIYNRRILLLASFFRWNILKFSVFIHVRLIS